jgi:hypothetical protein
MDSKLAVLCPVNPQSSYIALTASSGKHVSLALAFESLDV